MNLFYPGIRFEIDNVRFDVGLCRGASVASTFPASESMKTHSFIELQRLSVARLEDEDVAHGDVGQRNTKVGI